MKQLAVVYYSRTGNTKKMAELVVRGAGEVQGVTTLLFDVGEFPAEKVLDFQGLVIGTPTYYGHMAWPIKKLIDETVRFHGRLAGKVGGAFSSAANVGGGNETAVLGILQAMLIHGMIVQGDHTGDHYGPVSINAPDARAEEECLKLGRNVASLIERMND